MTLPIGAPLLNAHLPCYFAKVAPILTFMMRNPRYVETPF